MSTYNRTGMGNLDAEQARKYAKEMKQEQSEEETDKDIKGLRSKSSTFRTKSYKDVDKDYTKRYEEMEASKKLINKIPSRGYGGRG